VNLLQLHTGEQNLRVSVVVYVINRQGELLMSINQLSEVDPMKLNWCAGFFDAKGSFSLSNGLVKIIIENTNPVAISYFYEVMEKNSIQFKISERSKPSKSSKKKRWDMFILEDDKNILKFVNLMKNKILGKEKQLFLVEEFLFNLKNKQDFYEKMMKYLNQTCYMFINDDEKLWEKLGFVPDMIDHKKIDKDYHIVEINDFNNLDYLAGLLDADGIISMNTRYNKHSKQIDRDRYIPIISFTNTNKKIINNVCSTLKNNKIGYHVQFKIDEQRNRGKWNIQTSGIKRVLHLSNFLKNKLIIKKQQMDLINSYCKLKFEDVIGNNSSVGLSYKDAIDVLNKNS
jgi:hypothetical protein